MIRWTMHICRIVLVTSAATLSYAQATRTWVSGVGDDVNPCSRTAPCKTFPGAISKTAAGGEIDVLDPGGFGSVTIIKSITIDGGGFIAGVLVSGTPGMTVNAGPNDVVIIRNIDFNGVGGLGTNGINYIAGGTLIVEKVKIFGFMLSGIEVNLTGPGNLVVNDSSIKGGTTGIHVKTAVGRVNASLDHLSLTGAHTGVHAESGFTTISNSIISMNTSYGLLAETTGTLTGDTNLVTMNSVALQAGTGATLRVSNTDMFDNLTGFGCGGGTLISAGNNHKYGNTGGIVPTCNPTLVIPVQ